MCIIELHAHPGDVLENGKKHGMLIPMTIIDISITQISDFGTKMLKNNFSTFHQVF